MRKALVLAVLVLPMLLITIDATVLAVAIPFLSEDLRPSSEQVLWIGDIYSFVLAGLLVTMGSLGDRIGRKRLLLIGAAAFGLTSLAAGYATSPEMLIAARALQGLGGATLMPSTLSIIRNVFTAPGQRTMAIGIWSAAGGAGTAIGPVLGGLLLEHFWWGSVFVINVPVMLLLLLLGVAVLPESRDPAPGAFDMVGAATSTLGVVGVVYSVKELAAGADAWWQLVLPAGAGLLLLAAFVRRQRRLPQPMLDLSLFARRDFSGSVLAQLIAMMGLVGMLFFVAQYFQLVLGHGPLTAGLLELPASIGAAIAGVLAGVMANRYSRRLLVAAGLMAAAVSLGLLATVEATQLAGSGGYLLFGVALFGIGTGTGIGLTITSDSVVAAAPSAKAGAASAVSETAYELGAALGIGLLGSVVTGVYRSEVAPVVDRLAAEPAAGVRDSLGGAVDVARLLPGDVGGLVLQASRESFVSAMQVGSATAGVLLAAAAVAAFLLLPRHAAEAPAEPDVQLHG